MNLINLMLCGLPGYQSQKARSTDPRAGKRDGREVFVRLRLLYSPRRIFVIGNAFGFSALALALLFPAAAVAESQPWSGAEWAVT